MTLDVIYREKLRRELLKTISSEAQVVYILVLIRKILETNKEEKKRYFALYFYCCWAVHPTMDRAGARGIIERFNQIQDIVVSEGREKVPSELNKNVARMVAVETLYENLKHFIAEHSLPGTILSRDGWIAFLTYYGKVIQGSPLVFAHDEPTLCTKCKEVTRKQTFRRPISRIDKVVVETLDTPEGVINENETFSLRFRWTAIPFNLSEGLCVFDCNFVSEISAQS